MITDDWQPLHWEGPPDREGPKRNHMAVEVNYDNVFRDAVFSPHSSPKDLR